MNKDECVQAITYANQIDPRVQLNDPTLEVWSIGLSNVPASQVRWAINQHYANTDNPAVINPRAIRRMITTEVNKQDQNRRALNPGKTIRHPNEFRSKNPERWDELVQMGREQYYEDLRRRGINVTPPWEQG